MTSWPIKQWLQVPFDDVCKGILESGGIGGKPAPAHPQVDLADSPQARYRALVDQSWLFLRFLPPCDWYRVRIEGIEDLSSVRVIAEESWFPEPATADRGLQAVAQTLDLGCSHGRRVADLERSIGTSHLDRRITLLGRERAGPFSILDGNHRLLALTRQLMANAATPCAFDVHVGLSYGPCRWNGDVVHWEERPPREGGRRFVLRVW
jgi:hypothetical protein